MITPKRTDAFPPVVYVIIAVLLWSTGGLFIKLATLDAFQITFFRSLLAAVTVAILTRKQGLKINAFGVLTSVIYAALLFLFVWATKQTTAANAIFLQYTAPIYILVLAPFVIGEKFHWRDLVTVVFCIGGMSLFFVGELRISDYQGNIAALFSGVFLGLYIMLLKHPRATGEFSPPRHRDAELSKDRAVATGSRQASEPGAVATVVGGRQQAEGSEAEDSIGEIADASQESVPRAVATGSLDSGSTTQEPTLEADVTTNPQSAIHNPQSVNPAIAVIYGNLLLALLTLPSGITAIPVMNLTDLGSVAFLGIIQIGVSYVLFIKGVTGGTRPLDASIIGFIEPLLNPVWVFLFVGERPSRWALFGGAIIITIVIAHTAVQYKMHTPWHRS